MGFGQVTASAELGQALNLPVPVHLEPGEHIGPECVSAEVAFGETRLGRDKVRVRLEPTTGSGAAGADWVARVITTHVVDEPVIEVELSVGCARRFSRRFVAFADPPSTTAPAPLNPPGPPSAAEARVPTVATDVGAGATGAAPASRAPAPSVDRGPTRAASAATAPAARPRTSARRNPAAAAARAPDASPGSRLLLDAAGPRLKADTDAPHASAVAPGEQAAASAVAATTEQAPESERLRALEKELAELRRESQATRESMGALQARLAEAEYRSRAVPWLASLLLLALGVAAWLTLRLRRQQDAAADAPRWWAPETAAPARATAVADTPDLVEPADLGPIEVPLPEARPLAEAPATAPMPVTLSLEREPASLPAAEGPYERTRAMAGPTPFFALDTGAADLAMSREVSVEELLDLEQQAEFFIALGQEDAAIDLLMSHLRSTGGLSPLPYTKLLEIYRRQGDRDAYERIRARFNRRFNAYAPDWDAGPLSGRALEDYGDVVQHLQALWPQPLDAMAMLEAMLFRKDAAHELFDLPAYKDVLLLYAIARDLWQQGAAGRQPGIDVLLPLGEDAA